MPVLIVPEVAAVVIALLVLLCLLAVRQLMVALSQALPDWHIPGFGSIAGHVASAADRVYQFVLSQLGSALSAMVRLLSMPIQYFTWLFSGISDALAQAYRLGAHLVTVVIPSTIHALTGLINYVQAHAIAYAASLYRLAIAATVAAEARVTGLISYVQAHIAAYALSLYRSALVLLAAAEARLAALISYVQIAVVHYADFLYSQAVALVAAAEARALAHALSLYHSAVALVESRYRAAIAYADAAIGAAITALQQHEHVLIGKALAAVWPRVIANVDSAIAVADKDFADAIADLKAIGRAVPTDAAGAIAGTALGIAALVKLAEDCVMPNCRNLSKYGRDIQSLFGVVEGAMLIGLLAECAHDPAGVADEARSVLSPVLTGAGDLVRAGASL